MYARVPGSSANLGPGFDTLAVALELFVEVTVEPADAFAISSEGAGAGLFDDERHLAAVVAREVLGHDRFTLHVNSQIPLARGLGSSAALAVAAAAAAGAPDSLALATRVDGHPENAAASRWGGLVAAGVDATGAPVARTLELDHEWRFVLVVPDEQLSTADARAVLPSAVPFVDAVANLNAMGLLIAGLADHQAYCLGATDDRLHQPYRGALLPFAEPLLAVLRGAGALGSCWSGAGSSMLALCVGEAPAAVAEAARAFLDERSLGGEVLTLEADRMGLVTL
ncbi:MAG: homoserine kinase [Acidimicrobiales bacterium]